MTKLSPTWAALKAVTNDLMGLRGQLAELEAYRLQRKAEAFGASDESSVSGKDRFADVATVDVQMDIVNVKADIAAKADFQTLLLAAVQAEVEVV